MDSVVLAVLVTKRDVYAKDHSNDSITLEDEIASWPF